MTQSFDSIKFLVKKFQISGYIELKRRGLRKEAVVGELRVDKSK